MFLRAGWKAGLSNFWGLLFFWETGGSGQAGRAVETCTGEEGAASWVSALPTGTGRGERSLNSSRCFLEKRREQELLAGRNAYQMAGSANT